MTGIPPGPTNSFNNQSSFIPIGAIVGGSIGGFVGVILLIFLGFCVRRRGKRNGQREQPDVDRVDLAEQEDDKTSPVRRTTQREVSETIPYHPPIGYQVSGASPRDAVINVCTFFSKILLIIDLI